MPTWMVAEDEPDIYDVLLAMFGMWGIDGVAFTDGAEAVAWIEEVDAGHVRGDLPELAILDIKLPDVTGPEVGARLRASPVLHNIAIVLITAYYLTPAEEREAIALAQADLLLYKPLPGFQELREKLDQVLARRKAGHPDDGAAPAQPVPGAPDSEEQALHPRTKKERALGASRVPQPAPAKVNGKPGVPPASSLPPGPPGQPQAPRQDK